MASFVNVVCHAMRLFNSKAVLSAFVCTKHTQQYIYVGTCEGVYLHLAVFRSLSLSFSVCLTEIYVYIHCILSCYVQIKMVWVSGISRWWWWSDEREFDGVGFMIEASFQNRLQPTATTHWPSHSHNEGHLARSVGFVHIRWSDVVASVVRSLVYIRIYIHTRNNTHSPT